jgi:adenylyltransferase/sulfurtransferase
MFTTEELKRYMKQLLLADFGVEGQQQLKKAKVVVIGAGGLGCPVLQYLTATGVGTIGIVDGDVVEASNLHRQVLYNMNDTGKKKAAVAAEKLSLQNPYTLLIQHPVFIEETNVMEILSDYDLVIDGCDNFATRYIVNDAAVALHKPLVYGSILGYEGQIAVFNRDGSKNLRDLFPEPPSPEDVPSCSENGVLGTVPGIIGNILAQTAISVLLGRPSFENTFVVFNTLTLDKVTLKM